MNFRDVVAAGNLFMRVHKHFINQTSKRVSTVAEPEHPSDVTLRKALKHLQFAAPEIEHAVKSTIEHRTDSDAGRIKKALVLLRAGNVKAK